MREIAKACHCSAQTVSFALRGVGGVSDQRRKEILAQAKAMGWKPNPLANAYMSQLKQQKRMRFTGNLAVLSFAEEGPQMSDLLPHLRTVIHSFQERAEELGYAMDLIWAHAPAMNAAALQRILNHRNILGVFLTTESKQASWLMDVSWSNLAVCAAGFRKTPLKVNTINHDRSQGMEMAFRKMVGMGYQKIGFACNRINLHLGAGKDRLQYQWLAETEFEPNTAPPWLFEEVNPASVRGLIAWIQREKLDAIIGTGKTIRLYRELPEKVKASIGYADLDARDYPGNLFAGVNQRHETTGKLMAEWLAKEVESNTVGLPQHPMRMLYSPEWLDGASLPDRRAARTECAT